MPKKLPEMLTEQWGLSLTDVKFNRGFSVPITNEELGQMLKVFPFIASRRAIYFDLENDEVVSYEEGQKMMKENVISGE